MARVLPPLSARGAPTSRGITAIDASAVPCPVKNRGSSIGKTLGLSPIAVKPPADASEKDGREPVPREPLTPETIKRLLQPPPPPRNVEDGSRLTSNEQWLQQRIVAFDAGGNQQRKKVLQEVLELVEGSHGAGMEQLFSVQAKFFFARVTSWFAVTLPFLFEIHLQVRVLMAFLNRRDEGFASSFIDTGVIGPLMRTLSCVCDVSDEVRCLAIAVLHKLAESGQENKEVLCARGLSDAAAGCIASGGVRWAVVRLAGGLLQELFHGNPKHRKGVLAALLGLLAQRVPLAQRVSADVVGALMLSERDLAPELLRDPGMHATIVDLALKLLLQGSDLLVCADAYKLLARMLECVNCDKLLHDFARNQVRSEASSAEQWLRLEKSIMADAGKQCDRHRGATVWLHRAVNRALREDSEAAAGTKAVGHVESLEELSIEAVIAEMDDTFRAEAALVLRWGIVIVLAKRDGDFCDELVKSGLTETLLACVLDSTKPVRQAIALVELHRLRLLSPASEEMSLSVLGPKLLRTITIEQFMSAAGNDDVLRRCRFRLRNVQLGKARHSAQEIVLRQTLIEHAMNDVMDSDSASFARAMTITDGNSSPRGGAGATKTTFLTASGIDATEADAEEEADGETVPRAGNGIFEVQRVPPVSCHKAVAGEAALLAGPGGGAGAGDYQVMLGGNENAFMGSLASMLVDLADASTTAMASAEATIAAASASASARSVRSSTAGRLTLAGEARERSPTRQLLKQTRTRTDHRPTPQFLRALALRDVPPRGVENRLVTLAPPRRRGILPPLLAPSRAESESSELSLRMMAAIDEPRFGRPAGHSAGRLGCGCHSHMRSVDETSLVADSSVTDLKMSQQYLSTIADGSLGPEQISCVTCSDPISAFDPISAGPSWRSSGTASENLPEEPSYFSLAEEVEDYEKTDIQMASSVSLLSLRGVRRQRLPEELSKSSVAKKRVLHVRRPPEHECIAFANQDDEDAAHVTKDRALGLLHPATKQKFADLQDMGNSNGRRPSVGSWAPLSARVSGSGHEVDEYPEKPPSARVLSKPIAEDYGYGSFDNARKVFDLPPWLCNEGPRGRRESGTDAEIPTSVRGFFPASQDAATQVR